MLLVACGGSTAEALVVDDSGIGIDTAPDATIDTAPVDSGIDSTPIDTAVDTAPDVFVYDGAPPPPPSYDEGAKDRAACKFGAGDLTTKTVGSKIVHGDDLPFKHVIVLMLENRSFDNVFSTLPSLGVKDVDVPPSDASNPDPSAGGAKVTRFHETRSCIVDVPHDWDPVHLQYGDGKLDGFVASANPGGARAMGYEDSTDLPLLHFLAQNYAISDRHFSGTLGPTWPNRFFFYGATAYGRTKTPDTPPLGKNQLMKEMEAHGRDWKIYRDGITSFAIVYGPSYNGSSMSSFDDDVKNDKLPALVLLDPSFSGSGENDMHPPSNIQLGEAYVTHVLDTLASNEKAWKSSVLFITFDEHGGFYDHVPPPAACIPDGDKPPSYAYDRMGFRVPMIAMGPWVKPKYVSHFVTDHASLARFIENRFDLEAMTARDANAWPMLDLFDFDHVAFDKPVPSWPHGAPSAASVEWCAKNPAGTGRP